MLRLRLRMPVISTLDRTKTMIRSILVLESPWDANSVRSTSVWPFLSEFSKITGLEAFHQSFSDASSFAHWVRCFNNQATKPGNKLLYVAAHGSKGRISGLKRKINGNNIAGVLVNCPNITHVHFGSCLFGSKANLVELLRQVSHCQYIGGYTTEIDWIESMALDLLLLGRMVNRTAKHARTTTTIKDLLISMPGLSKTLGYQFAYRHGPKKIFFYGDKESAV